jgi:hypothetical protein
LLKETGCDVALSLLCVSFGLRPNALNIAVYLGLVARRDRRAR